MNDLERAQEYAQEIRAAGNTRQREATDKLADRLDALGYGESLQYRGVTVRRADQPDPDGWEYEISRPGPFARPLDMLTASRAAQLAVEEGGI